MDAWVTVGPPAAIMDLPDLLRKGGIFSCLLGRRAIFPVVVAAPQDPKCPAQQRDRVVSLLRIDEPEKLHRIPSSLAKKAAAFRRISFS
jgi:hypothetical protein